VDWNNDGKMDLIAGDTRGNVTLFLNTGTKDKPVLAEGTKVEADGKAIVNGSHPLAGSYSKLHMGDWDGDGLKDLLVGHNEEIILYKNAGTASAPKLRAPTKLECPGGKWPFRPSPYVVDWDGDGKQDLLVGCEQPQVVFYRNVGTAKEPKLAAGKPLELKGDGFQTSYRCRIGVTDWNNDGKLDLLVGTFYSSQRPAGGNVWLFLGK